MQKLHLGSGEIIIPGWINIDIESADPASRHDLTMPLPYADASATHIFTEHFIEHVDYDDALRLLVECRRVLSDSGLIRIATPDLEWLVDVYQSGITTAWRELWQPDTPCKLINEGMRSWGHKFLYDRSELYQLLRSAGFNNIVEKKWRESDDQAMQGLESRPFHNDIIMEADCLPEASNPFETPTWIPREPDGLLAEQGKQLALLSRQHSLQREEIESLLAGHTVALKHSADQARHIDGLEKSLEDRGRHIVGLEQSLHDKSTHIAALEADAVQRLGRIGELESSIGDLVTHGGNLQQAISIQQTELSRLAETTQALQVQETFLANELRQHAALVSELERKRAEELALISQLEQNLAGQTADRIKAEQQLQVLHALHGERLEEINSLKLEAMSLGTRLQASDELIGRIRSTWLGRLAIRMLRGGKDPKQP